jgi:hypothetical protein
MVWLFSLVFFKRRNLMEKWARYTIAILSLQLFVSGLIIAHLSYKLGYEQGRASVYRSYMEDGNNDGTCYVPGGCEHDLGYYVTPKGKKVKVK